VELFTVVAEEVGPDHGSVGGAKNTSPQNHKQWGRWSLYQPDKAREVWSILTAWQQEAKKEGRINNVCFNGLVLLLSMRLLKLETKMRNRH